MAGVEVGIFQPLPPHHFCCHCPHHGLIGRGQGIGTCDIPHQNSSLLPGDNGYSIRTFAIGSVDVDGSKWDGIFAASSDLLRTSLMAAWRGWRPLLKQQLRPWVPRSPTSDPHWLQRWGRQSGRPRRSPTATLTTSLSRCTPREETGRAFSHAPASLVATAKRRALVVGSGDDSRKFWYRPSEVGGGGGGGGGGGAWLWPWLQMTLALANHGLGVSCSQGVRMLRTSSAQPTAEAR